jgi:hypothetical protein
MRIVGLTLFVAILSSILGIAISAAQAGKARMQATANNPTCAVFNKNPQAKETVTWTGPCKNGAAHGKGTEQWKYFRLGEPQTETYVGEMRAGKRHGRGKVQWQKGSTYDGAWKDGIRHGEGLYTWPGGNKYKGSFVRGKRQGQGIMVYHGGSKYKGAWVNGDKHGHGIFVYRNGDQIHGEFKNDKPSAVKCYIKAEKRWKKGPC